MEWFRKIHNGYVLFHKIVFVILTDFVLSAITIVVWMTPVSNPIRWGVSGLFFAGLATITTWRRRNPNEKLSPHSRPDTF